MLPTIPTSSLKAMLALGAGCAIVALASPAPHAQLQRLHLNPVIAKLVQGETVYGLNTGDLSLANAREVARAPVDFVYADLEHNPLDFPSLQIFLMGLQD